MFLFVVTSLFVDYEQVTDGFRKHFVHSLVEKLDFSVRTSLSDERS